MGTVEYNANSGARPQPGCKFGVPGSLGGNNIVIKYAIINSFLNKFATQIFSNNFTRNVKFIYYVIAVFGYQYNSWIYYKYICFLKDFEMKILK